MTKKQKELAEQAKVELIKQINNFDTEEAHGIADDCLCDLLTSLGFKEVVELYLRIKKWYA